MFVMFVAYSAATVAMLIVHPTYSYAYGQLNP